MTSDSQHKVELNVKFDHPSIEQWAKRYLSDKAIEALALVQTSPNTPTLPSLLVAFRDPVLIRVLRYQPVRGDGESLPPEKEDPITLGHLPFPIEAMYLPSVKYADKMTVAVFFERYYALMSVNLKEDELDGDNRKREQKLLHAFPILVCSCGSLL